VTSQKSGWCRRSLRVEALLGRSFFRGGLLGLRWRKRRRRKRRRSGCKSGKQQLGVRVKGYGDGARNGGFVLSIIQYG
jgi:hypothetical protein